ncbi:hypothetical protein [Citrobacter enshiensis]|uniref:hypothetical protein n=1 Tax=Citrobacter enshiensis TaxID=2971264 RepID=UPI0023E84477|nr:hypothetical protein [Citrobacter enshiensis]WET39525.1 hypothetical protein P2W74_16305 [Citrobacter enshiensis]
MYVYDIQQQQWIQVLPAIARNFNIQEGAKAADIVQRDTRHPGLLKVTQAVRDDENEVTTTQVMSKKLLVLK